VIAGLLSGLLAAQGWALTIKLGSVAPVGSPWDNALRSLAADWSRISGGQVELKIYLGGVAGDEPDMIRKMRIGQLQAAAVTSLALNQINPDVLALSTPFLIESDQELDYVLDRTRPYFTGLLEERGFKVLALSKAGWVRFFSRRPVVVPADLKGQKLAVSTGDPSLVDAWASVGFDVVPLGIPDTMVGLQSGSVDATYGTPLLAAGYQWFGPAPRMSGLRVAPVLAAIVVSARVWNQVPEPFRAPMLEAVARVDRRLYEETARLEETAVDVMKRHGLVIDPATPEAMALWQAEMDRGFEHVVGKAFSRATYDRITALLAEFRAGSPAGRRPAAMSRGS
jgi:TRAP-type C4-dicarboxylate transport system substrate-binding protein